MPQKYKRLQKYYKKLCAKKLDNLDEKNKFLKNTLKIKPQETENLNRKITTTEIKAVIKKSNNKQKS